MPPLMPFPPRPTWGYNGMWMPPPPAQLNYFHLEWTAPRRPIFDRISCPVHDRLWQSSYVRHDRNVKKVYRVKESVISIQNSDSSTAEIRTTAADIIEIGSMKVVTEELGKGPIVFGDNLVKFKHVPNVVQVAPKANDDEASSSKQLSKYLQLRWCPSSLSHIKKTRLQRLLK